MVQAISLKIIVLDVHFYIFYSKDELESHFDK